MMRLWDTPLPIPNRLVKTQTADDTWWEAAWESKWLPDSRYRNNFVLHRFNKVFRYLYVTIILDSSVVEHSAVNRRVVGSKPTRGAIMAQWSSG